MGDEEQTETRNCSEENEIATFYALHSHKIFKFGIQLWNDIAVYVCVHSMYALILMRLVNDEYTARQPG